MYFLKFEKDLRQLTRTKVDQSTELLRVVLGDGMDIDNFVYFNVLELSYANTFFDFIKGVIHTSDSPISRHSQDVSQG